MTAGNYANILECKPTSLSGCYELCPVIHQDNRGAFIKTYHVEAFAELGLATEYKEEYYSVSKKNVLRGLHFQIPPYACDKLIYVPTGKVFDVAVDLRRDSPTYGKYHHLILDAEYANMFYLPKGLAHGFYTLSDYAVLIYKTTAVYNAACDTGILWNSLDIPWPCREPLTSKRDKQFITFADFCTPF